jgi:glucosamine-6-phosphate deaminase
MLHLEKEIPIKDTYAYLAKFPRFSFVEKIPPRFFPTSAEASLAAATSIKEEIERKNAKGEICVIGLATGSTPLRVYKELIRMHKEEGLSFKKVVTFNLDEYFPITKQDP